MKITFGQWEGEKLVVEVHGYVQDKYDNYYDANWMRVSMEIRAGKFSGNTDALFMTAELVKFAQQLRELYQSLEGTAEFKTMENQLNLKVSGDGKGHMKIAGEVRDDASLGNRLIFSFDLDQTFIKQSLNELEKIISTFPVREVKQ